jgi:hexosaminidase
MTTARMNRLLFSLTLLVASVAPALGNTLPALIPLPQKVEARDGVFQVAPDTKIYASYESLKTARQLAGQLHQATGYSFPVGVKLWNKQAMPNAIFLTTKSADATLGAEGYELSVATNSVVIRAPQQAGLFYGVQTLLQLLPPQVYATNATGVSWQVSCVEITDQPRFKWRGLMLDVARHFYTKAEVERLLDLMAQQKLNTFHWHLVDDQGWRIEIKKYPLLTQVGAWRAGVNFGLASNSTTAYGPDGRYGGFYTQKDIREVVAYAQARHITIVPEIEMPGHSGAALRAYPQYDCTGKPPIINHKGGVFHGVYCAGNDDTFVFLQNVLDEVMDLFPGQYIHIGGDEVPKSDWKHCEKCQARIKAEGLKNEDELQSYFIRRIETIVDAHGHNLIGWSEIREGGLAPSAAVMDWIGGAVEAASAGHHVVMSPTKFCYFDHYQSTNQTSEPKAIGDYLPLSRVYQFEAIPEGLPPESQNLILGGQANLWTEYVPNFNHVEYMVFPRACALSEALWSPKEARNWNSFQERLPAELARLDAEGVNYRKSRNE